jgi:2-isopropylmalate synthase
LRRISLIDQTIREGMQYQGVVFSYDQRLKILEFQEALGVDVCQAGYPPAHPEEAAMVKSLADHAGQNRFRIRVAALGRAFLPDAKILVATGIRDVHFHLHLPPDVPSHESDHLFSQLVPVIDFVRTTRPDAVISLAMLDMGKTPLAQLETAIRFLNRHRLVDILSLPDTSGIMAPNQVTERIRHAAALAGDMAVSIHCHNDLGMASANSVMGVLAGARILEVSAAGIGERNGIGDLYLTTRILADQNVPTGFSHDRIDLVRDYYLFVDTIVKEQTGQSLIHPATPVFGQAAGTHVAGTHARHLYGAGAAPEFHLNVLCGNHLVKNYLTCHHIGFDPDRLPAITAAVKEMSIRKSRRLTPAEVREIAGVPD